MRHDSGRIGPYRQRARTCPIGTMSGHLLLIGSVLFGSYGIAVAQPSPDGDPPRFRVDTSLILIPVTVTDTRGANIGGLGKDRFTILDNRQPQPIAAFYTEDSPASIGLVLDVSGSVKGALDREKAAAHAILQLDRKSTRLNSSHLVISYA